MHRDYEGNTWERQEWENDAAYAAFLAYRDLGVNRSIDAAYRVYSEAREKGKSAKKRKKALKSAKKAQKREEKVRPSGTFLKWRIDYEWMKRASDFDVYTQRALDEVELEAKKKVKREYVEQVQIAALEALKKMLEKPSLEKVRKKYKVEKIDGRDVQQLVEMITEQQSVFAAESAVRYVLDRTMSDYFRNSDDEIDVQSLSDEELEDLRDNKP